MARKKDYSSVADGFDFNSDDDVRNTSIGTETHTETGTKPDETHGQHPPKNSAKKSTKKQSPRKPGRPEGTIKKAPEEKAQHFSTSLPPEVVLMISEQAKKEDRPISRVIASAVKYYIENH